MYTFSQGGNVQLNGMGGPDEDISPANSNLPLVEGGNPTWNEFLQYVPEENRASVVPVLKQWDERYKQLNDENNGWKNLGVDPSQAEQALQVKRLIESQPQAVYERLGKYLGVTPAEAKAVTTTAASGEEDKNAQTQLPADYEKLQQMVNLMANHLLSQREQETRTAEQREMDAQIDKELNDLKKKYGEFDENEIVMRASHYDISLEEALKQWNDKTAELVKRRPAPWLISGGGEIPNPSINPAKLDRKGTRDLVAQTLQHAIMEGNK